MPTTDSPHFFREAILVALVLAASALLLYGHTLNVPFYLDDYGAIGEKYLLRDLFETFKRACSQRGLTNLSFALNYRVSGWSLPMLHLTNISLHVGCAWLVWLFLRKFFSGQGLPLFGSLFFLSHPLQTQAVTYLVQRSTLLATFFFLVAFLSHLRARAALDSGYGRTSPYYLRPYLGAIAAGICAVLSKENAAILPLVLIVYDRFFPLSVIRSRRQAFLDYLPYFVVPLLLAFAVFLRLIASGEMTSQSTGLISLAHNSPGNYLMTQFSVLWVYLRLLLLPFGQALEHNYPVVGCAFTLQNAAALVGWLALGWFLWRLRQRRPLLVFGVVWALFGLLVESSVIPLDPLFEHRLYLSMAGFVLVLLDIFSLLPLAWRRSVAVVILLFLGLVTWQRNALWCDPVAFYEANVQLTPSSERAVMALMLLYKDAGRYADAERMARQLITVNPRFSVASQELAGFLARRGATKEALAVVETALLSSPGDPELFRAGAMVWLTQGKAEAAVDYLLRGVATAPQNFRMHSWLGALYFETGELPLAESAYRQSLRLNDKVAVTHKNLAKALYGQGRIAEAQEELTIALSQAPGSPDILEGLGNCALVLGDLVTAQQVADKLHYSDPTAWQDLQSAISMQTRGGHD